MKAARWYMLLVCVLMLAVSCAPNSVKHATPVNVLNQQAHTYAQTPQEYTIEVGDTLDIKFMYNAELNEMAVPVRPDGKISLQLAQDIPAAGSTPSQLRKVLYDKYAAELKTPEIAVIVRTFGGNMVFVDGEIAAPKSIPFRGRMTVMQAVAQAEGMRETARLSNVIVIRKDFQGQPMAANLDLRKVIDGTDFSQDVALMPYDIVYIPKSHIANWDKFIDEYVNRSIPSRIPGFGSFNNPYSYAFGGWTKVQGSGAVIVNNP